MLEFHECIMCYAVTCALACYHKSLSKGIIFYHMRNTCSMHVFPENRSVRMLIMLCYSSIVALCDKEEIEGSCYAHMFEFHAFCVPTLCVSMLA